MCTLGKGGRKSSFTFLYFKIFFFSQTTQIYLRTVDTFFLQKQIFFLTLMILGRGANFTLRRKKY